MPELELSAGRIDYEDTGGAGPVLVLTHGLVMDSSLWRNVVRELPDYRCLDPTLPLGAHRQPMRPDADLSMAGIAGLMTKRPIPPAVTDLWLPPARGGGEIRRDLRKYANSAKQGSHDLLAAT